MQNYMIECVKCERGVPLPEQHGAEFDCPVLHRNTYRRE